jgi:hypothetical protein
MTVNTIPVKVAHYLIKAVIMFGMSETQTISPEVRAYMSAIGRKKTEAKTQSSRRNAATAAAARRKDLSALPCLCGQCPDDPKSTCPRGRLLRQRMRNAAKKANQSGANQ